MMICIGQVLSTLFSAPWDDFGHQVGIFQLIKNKLLPQNVKNVHYNCINILMKYHIHVQLR